MFRRLLLIPLVLAPLAACGQTAARVTTPPGAAAVTTPPAAAPAPQKTATSEPAPSTAALTGTQHAFLTATDPAKRTITFDLVDWFEGPAAVAACKQDGVTDTSDDWCLGYYYRNNSHKLRTLQVKPGARVRVVAMDDPMRLVPADLGKFRTSLKASGDLFVFTVAGGDITAADEVYHP